MRPPNQAERPSRASQSVWRMNCQEGANLARRSYVWFACQLRRRRKSLPSPWKRQKRRKSTIPSRSPSQTHRKSTIHSNPSRSSQKVSTTPWSLGERDKVASCRVDFWLSLACNPGFPFGRRHGWHSDGRCSGNRRHRDGRCRRGCGWHGHRRWIRRRLRGWLRGCGWCSRRWAIHQSSK